MARQRRRGFTVVELMVVIMIIALLMALLFPAVNSARESGRRTECMNKMREIGQAVMNYESRKSRFPGWREGGFTLPNDDKVSWTVLMLPGLGRKDVYEAWLANGPSPISLADLLVCASDFNKTGNFATSYIANTGREDVLTGVPNYPQGILGPDWRANAVFLDKHCYEPQQDTSFIRNNDGMGTTLMLSENTDPTDWSRAADGEEYAAGMMFQPPVAGTLEAPLPDVNPINAKGSGGTAYDRARPSSNHPGGVNVVFCSGNGTFLRDTIAYRIYVALMTPKGRGAMEPGTLNPSPTVQAQQKLPPDLFQ